MRRKGHTLPKAGYKPHASEGKVWQWEHPLFRDTSQHNNGNTRHQDIRQDVIHCFSVPVKDKRYQRTYPDADKTAPLFVDGRNDPQDDPRNEQNVHIGVFLWRSFFGPSGLWVRTAEIVIPFQHQVEIALNLVKSLHQGFVSPDLSGGDRAPYGNRCLNLCRSR